MKIKKGIWQYRLPDAVVQIRNALRVKKDFCAAIAQVRPEDIDNMRGAEKRDGKIPDHVRGTIFVALKIDEFGSLLLIYPTPETNYTAEFQVLEVKVL